MHRPTDSRAGGHEATGSPSPEVNLTQKTDRTDRKAARLQDLLELGLAEVNLAQEMRTEMSSRMH